MKKIIRKLKLRLKSMKRSISFNSEINIGNILTLIIIIVSIIGLSLQRKSMQIKIDDLSKVINRLEQEERTRELLGHDLELKNLNSFTYSLNYTIDQIKSIQKNSDLEDFFQLIQLNTLINILRSNTNIVNEQEDIISIFEKRNAYKMKILKEQLRYINNVELFIKNNKPQRENHINISDHIIALEKYNLKLSDTLEYHLSILNKNILKSKSKVKKLEQEYFELLK